MKRRLIFLIAWWVGINPLLAQLPTITSFSPQSGPVGTQVTISGSNFDATLENNIVYFGGVKAIVLAASASELIVEVPSGATYQPITIQVDGRTISTSEPFAVTFESEGTLSASNSLDDFVSLSPGAFPVTTVQADFDGDGLLDIASANEDGSSYSVFRNTSAGLGDISFTSDLGSGIGLNPKDMVYADFDGDGKMDIATGNNSLFAGISNVGILLNTSTIGSISFDPMVSFSADSDPLSIAAGDLDGDGKTDIVVVDGDNSQVSVFENTTNLLAGVMNFAAHVDFNVGATPVSVAIADIDGDGLLDIITANEGDRSVSILRNTSTGGSLSFEAKVDIAVNSSSPTYKVLVGDLDGDGLAEVITKNSRYLTVLQNESTVSNVNLTIAQDIIFDTGFGFPGLGDLNGDGLLDALVSPGSSSIEILLNTSITGSISFASAVAPSYGAPFDFSPFNISVADMDGDGEADIIMPGEVGGFIGAATPLVYVVRNLGSGNSIDDFTLAGQSTPTTIDEVNHTILLGAEGIDITTAESSFTLSTGASAEIDGVTQVSGVTLNDFTNPVTYTVIAEDGTSQDWVVTVILGCSDDAVSEIVEACESFEFGSETIRQSGRYISTFENKTGCDSVVTLDLTIIPTSFYENVYATSSYDFDGATLTTSGQYTYGPFIGSTGCDSTYILNLTIEPDTFEPQSLLQFHSLESVLEGLTGASYIGDLDGDNHQDVMILGATAGIETKRTQVYFNNGDGTFEEATDHGITDVFTRFRGNKLFDIDGDNDLDFLLFGFSDRAPDIPTGELYINDGSGNFALKTDAGLPQIGGVGSDAADVDGDGDLDLIISGVVEEGEEVGTKLWLNDGNEVFTRAAEDDFPTVEFGSVDFGDVDNDGDPDVFITGDPDEGLNIAQLYINDGLGGFTLRSGSTFYGISASTVEILDLDGDDDLDIFTSGRLSDALSNSKSIIYKNDGLGNFTKEVSDEIPEIASGQAAFADFDGDGDPDLVLTGTLGVDGLAVNDGFSGVFLNNGFGHFTKSEICSLIQPENGAVSVGDLDGDGRMDFLITGQESSDLLAVPYLNKEISNDLTVEVCGSYEFDGATLTESGNYQGIFTDDLGCTYPVNLDLTIIQKDETEVTLDNCGAYEFGTQLLTESGIYTETFMNQAGCDSTVTLTFGYLEDPPAVISQVGVILTVEPVEDAEYRWFNCDTNELLTGGITLLTGYIPFDNGNFAVEVTNSAGCVTMSECIFFDWVLAHQEQLQEEARVFPSQTNGNFTVDLNQTVDDVEVHIISLDGRVIQERSFESFSKQQLQFNAEQGLYLVQVKAGGHTIFNQRIIKK